MKPFFVYLLRCSDASYYVGQTDDMALRLRQHADGAIGYTATHKPVELLWQGEFETREGAIAFEQRIKGWSRAKKEALIRGDWAAIQQLARSRADAAPQPARPEPVEGRDADTAAAPRLRQAQPERWWGGKNAASQPVRSELVEERDAATTAAPRLRQAQPERWGCTDAASQPVRSELVEGRDADTAAVLRLRQAQPERSGEAHLPEEPSR
ncbi:GIY-YIG nuclease family protein [Xenophilus sp.]|uniref:GIY-YIG nuclease family protein n=1 Tax=Xenophilus sp. TaxID=1873499 RepID=UPI0037DC5D28